MHGRFMPWAKSRDYAAIETRSDLSDTVKAKILGENARQLFAR